MQNVKYEEASSVAELDWFHFLKKCLFLRPKGRVAVVNSNLELEKMGPTRMIPRRCA